MNQILYTIENEEEKNRIRSIILFFAITIMIFGIVMLAMGGYQIAAAKAAREEAIEATKIPNIELEFEEESNNAIIRVSHVREVKNIIYSWNNEEEIELVENSTTDIEEYVELLPGTNTLYVTVTDIEGKTSTTSQEFTYKGTYMEVSVIDNKSLRIVVTDMVGLQSVAYKWNSEEEIMAYPDGEDLTVIEVISDIPIGQNTITVKAVNNENEIEEKQVTVQGISRPTIGLSYNTDKTLITVRLNDDQGIESYSYKLSNAPISEIAKNGSIIPEFKDKLKVVTSQTKEGQGQNSIVEQLEFLEGFNYIEITIINIEGVEETYSGWCAK